jgi:hypothetical protein
MSSFSLMQITPDFPVLLSSSPLVQFEVSTVFIKPVTIYLTHLYNSNSNSNGKRKTVV